ncbi:MAG: D-isomer specific 2-hydroxyacid dehydrogenase NAD-binding protein [Candidatus Uhrbacteria bacterium GW2011_GWF2_41_16]|uniref:D-isomer specific 2-hydroxyacid dehydrogenase NAD-binding protein n=2 Tax=Candidatus Uhriibacteriota TaxID=1752732 RepID=A0A0G0V9B5_9BACT|nr:MAG: D-isomer specific 2-hydroxyacid dehydrogenase NAD-binding protein [Candidatus Uhrbacteria bacterium GW2011_GWA2_41_10]KKR86229.1 MAG: D-isomer specific 2-hydroxyacid dehydrogenase NAD-binding protein [Candidatus Uhrbacteria bacterium GW2011_GWC2_41_11]KKR97583.1 MAG: D-isomer specific 2-hydroxyacid dehydrogenase NAD-binding protein [Candidatus Uhrbacteria bacterium GW2011_GWF2_41_16]HBP00281.1 D-glycerate dehydrogenase [Candidatus Uhrbacteria bacterium]
MTRIFITRAIPESGLKLLKKRKGLKIEVYEKDQIIPHRELLRRVKGVNILLSLLTDRIDTDIFDAAGPQLKLVANYAVGFDNIDVVEAKKRGIALTNTPGDEIAETVAEHTVAMMFALAHRIVESDTFMRAGKYKGWNPNLFLGTDIIGKTLGIIGTGKIGTCLIRRVAEGFGIRILYHDVRANPELEKTFHAVYRTKDQLLKEADFVSLHVPLLPSTHHLIGTKELKRMKKTAFLINTSRGPVIDIHALVQALKTKQIAGAGLDVHECEPNIACNKEDILTLRRLSNVILTPHTASATIETRDAMSCRAAKNILAFLRGDIPPNLIK